ncbi:MAG: ParB domain protein nuclease [Gemmataceae bacterium]|nr:ParB domain protein nuclease [Gemmataceae bacterium]
MQDPTYPDLPIESWPLDRLKPHPRQAALFGDTTEEEIRTLAEDLRRHGLQHPVEALPDGTLVCGHRRVAAAQLLGWDEIRVRIRADLAADPAAAETRLIQDNLMRRQLSPLAVARCYLGLRHLVAARPGGRLPDAARGDVRDLVGRQLGLSGRHLDRLLAIVERCPVEVQFAVERHDLPIAVAGKVAGLRPEQREAVGAAIRSGVDPRQAVAQAVAHAVGKRAARTAALGHAVYKFVTQLKRAVEVIGPRVRDVRGLPPAAARTLEQAEELIRGLKRRAQEDKDPGSRTRCPGLAAPRERVSKNSDRDVQTGPARRRKS